MKPYALPLVLALCSACGDASKEIAMHASQPESEEIATASLCPDAPARALPAESMGPGLLEESHLVGTFQQVDNHQNRIVINDLLILTSNMQIPVPQSNGQRVSPQFPHHLVWQNSGYWSTSGSYNQGEGHPEWSNVELRAVSYNNGQLLDITLVQWERQPRFGEFGRRHPRRPRCPPRHPHPAPTPTPTPPCGHPDRCCEKLIQYRFERTAAADVY